MKIGQLARASEVPIDTIRYYEREALLPPPSRSSGGYRLYDEAALRRLRFIRRSKALGFSLDEIRQLLALTDSDAPAASVRALSVDKLQLIEAKLADLKAMQAALQRLIESCDGQGCVHHCPIVDALNREDPLLS